MSKKSVTTALGLAALLEFVGSGSVLAQQTKSEELSPEAAAQFDPAICERELAEGETLPPECEELAAQGPKDQVDAGEMRATMRRFVPSEQISEDSSVAFPNDI